MLVQRELGTFAKKVRRAIQVSRTYGKCGKCPKKLRLMQKKELVTLSAKN